MANYTATNKAKAQQLAQNKYKDSEMVYEEPAVFLEYLRNAPLLMNNLAEVKMSDNRVIELAYNKRDARALTAGRSHNHTFGVGGDSGIMSPTWGAKSDGFSVSLKEANGNVLSKEEMLANKMLNVWINMSNGFNTDAEDHLFANRSQINVSTQEGTFNAVSDTFEITESTEGERAIQITNMVMRDNLLKGGAIHFCDNKAFNKFQFQAGQGAQNSTNLSFQFQGQRFVNASRLGVLGVGVDATYTKGFWITAQEGSFGVLPWIPTLNRQGHVDTEATYGTSVNPILGNLLLGTHEYSLRSDTSGVNGEVQDVTTQLEFSCDLSFNNVPKAGAGESSMMAFALK